MVTGLCVVVGYDMLCSAPLDTTVLFCASQDVMCWVVLDVHFGLAVNVKLGDLMHPCVTSMYNKPCMTCMYGNLCMASMQDIIYV